jgi:hypothetical protein
MIAMIAMKCVTIQMFSNFCENCTGQGELSHRFSQTICQRYENLAFSEYTHPEGIIKI